MPHPEKAAGWQSLIILYFNGQTGTYGVGVQAAVITGYLS
jgi:hypothetical protein